MIELTTGVAFLLSSMYGVSAPTVATAATAIGAVSTTTEQAHAVVLTDRKAVEKYLRQKFADTPILVEVARCESTFSHFDKNGNLVRGKVDNRDVGLMQINEYYHLETAVKLGYDIHTIEGNIGYAEYLYKKQGLAPWKASAPCWNKEV